MRTTLFALCAFLMVSVCHAVEVPAVRTVVTSEKMITESGEGRIRFIGKVEAKYGNLQLKADNLEVYSDEKRQKLTKIVAVGNVSVRKGDRLLEGGRAEMIYAERKVVLTDHPVVVEKDNRIAGERIVYLYDKGSIMIEGGAGARASVLLSDSKEKKK